jgi:hypothetical protein
VQASAQNRFSTTGYTARKYVLGGFVTVYALVAYWGGHVSPRGEFFPVFNWSLFTHIWPHQTLPELHVVSIGDRKLDQPVNFFELDSYFESARLRSIVVTKTLGRLQAALLRNDAAEVARLRTIIETRHLGGHGPVEYEIRSVRFAPVERWKNKDYVPEQTVLARFKFEGGR